MFGLALSIKSRVRNCTPALFNQVVDSEQTARVCAEIEDALEKVKRGEMSREDFETYKGEQKKRLAIFTPHATFPKGRRLSEDAVPSGLSMYDIDHLDNLQLTMDKGQGAKRGLFERLVEHTLKREPITDEGMIAELKRLGICLVHVTPSTEGFRLFFKIPEHLYTPLSTGEGLGVRLLEEAQKWMSQQLDDSDYDGCVKDLARCSFVVPREYILYGPSEEMWEERPPLNIPEQARRPVAFPPVEGENRTLENGANSDSSPKQGRSGGVSEGLGRLFKGIPYASIISEWWRCSGGEPAEGERNVKLHKLAVNLRAICDNKKEVLMAVMPRFGLSEQELKSIVDSACKEEPKGVSKKMQSIIDQLTMNNEHADEDWDAEENTSYFTLPPSLKKNLAMGLKESLEGVPTSMHMPVLCSVLPIAAAYADQVEVEYCDGNRQRLGLMSIIRGEQASGKSVCKNVVDVWKRQFDEEDAIARKREEEWKERKKARKANEKAPDDPKVLIRTVPVTVSCSTLLKRFKNANGHCLYSFGEELDTLRKTNGAGSWSSKYDIYRLSFDNGEWGQDYNSDQAESGVVKVAYNWTMLGTDGAMRKCFKADNIENGLSSRVLVAEMPDSSFAKMPKFGKRSADDEAKIQEAVTRLRSYSGFVDTPRLRKAIERWVEEKRVEAAKDIDRVKDVYRKRAAVIGFRCGVIHHLLKTSPSPSCLGGGNERESGSFGNSGSSPKQGRSGGVLESKATIQFAVMMAEYVLEQQIKAFGEALQKEYVNARDECQRYGVNHSVFDQLAPTFSRDDLRALKQDCGESAIRTIVMRWKRDGWIEPVDRHHWKKVVVADHENVTRHIVTSSH
ncbi:MAG: DUF3987 domain-containing protein [Prevotella sp.]|nr:DUF3987 domain-containing protein [Prevotella sp.]